MSYMFEGAKNFDQDISDWNVSSVQEMNSMFTNAYSFNQDLSNWDVSNVTIMFDMFRDAEELSDNNKCAIHTSFSSNYNWEHDWESYCSD